MVNPPRNIKSGGAKKGPFVYPVNHFHPFPLWDPRYTLFHKICHLIITFSAFRHPCKGHQDHLIHGAWKQNPPVDGGGAETVPGWLEKLAGCFTHQLEPKSSEKSKYPREKLNYTWSVCGCCSLKKAPHCGDTCVGTQVSNKQLIVVVILPELFRH